MKRRRQTTSFDVDGRNYTFRPKETVKVETWVVELPELVTISGATFVTSGSLTATTPVIDGNEVSTLLSGSDGTLKTTITLSSGEVIYEEMDFRERESDFRFYDRSLG